MKPSVQLPVPAQTSANRRGFLGLLGGALTAAGLSLLTKSAVAAPLQAAPLATAPASAPVAASSAVIGGRGAFTMLDHLFLDAFSAHLNTPFRVVDADVSLELLKARDTSRGDLVRSFELILRGPLEPVLSTDTHLLRHGVLGDMALFLSPFKQEESGTFYHITFSHLLG